MSYTEKETIVHRNVEDEVKESYLRYSMSVIISRALPDVRDGLKPSQRRILYAMRQLNLGPSSKHRKCAKICGDTSGDYHPHGEGVIYPTLVRMAQDWVMLTQSYAATTATRNRSATFFRATRQVTTIP